MATAPEPIDPRIQLRLVAAGNWAVLRYSGSWSQANYQEHLSELKTLLEAQGVTTQGEPVLARYNAPFTRCSYVETRSRWRCNDEIAHKEYYGTNVNSAERVFALSDAEKWNALLSSGDGPALIRGKLNYIVNKPPIDQRERGSGQSNRLGLLL